MKTTLSIKQRTVFGRRFQPKGWAFVLSACVCAATFALGQWQLGRAQTKRDLAERNTIAQQQPAKLLDIPVQDPAAWVQTRVRIEGTFLPEPMIFLDQKMYQGRVGYHVIQALQVVGTQTHVLVNRGWVPADARRAHLPEVPALVGVQHIDGVALLRAPRALDAGGGTQGRVWQNLSIEQARAATGLTLEPLLIEQHGPTADTLVRDWPRPDAGIEKHLSYALQWFALSVFSIVLFILLSFRAISSTDHSHA
jgi:surfeit locus 1 family protein